MSVSVSTVAVGKTVTKAIEDYRNDVSMFVADYVAPPVKVMTKKGHMPRFSRANQKNIKDKVSPFAPSPRVDYGLGTTEFDCEVHRMATVLPVELESFDDTGLLSAAALGVQVDEALRINREMELATWMVASGNFTNKSAPGTKWDVSGGDPAKDVATMRAAVRTKINRDPQYGLCTFDVMLVLQRTVAELRAGGGSVALAPLAEVCAYLGIKELRVATAQYDSAKPGKTSVATDVWGSANFWLFHKPVQVGAYVPTFQVTTRYDKLSKARVEKNVDPEGLFIESRDCYDLVATDETAGYYLYTVI